MCKIFLRLIILSLSCTVFAQAITTVPIVVHTYARGDGPPNLVSNAVPFKPGTLTDARNVRILEGSNEVPIATKVVATWPQDRSIRSLLIQFSAPTQRNYTLQIGSLRTSLDRTFTAVVWDLPQRIFTLPAAYLSESLIFWEQMPLGQTGFPAWDRKQLNAYYRIETIGTAPCVRDDQYYGAITTTHQLYARTGDLKYLVNARRWALHHRRDQIWLAGANAGRPRCPGGYLNNTRYTFPQGLIQDYFMFGDEEAKRVSGLVVDNFYMNPEWGWWWHKAPSARGFWTEREPAFALMGVLSHYEGTNDPKYLNFAREKVALLHRMQVENGRRAWVHNLYDHDSDEGCPDNAWGSSPWMSGLLLEAVIKYHKLTGDPIARESILMAVDDLKERYLATSGEYAGKSFIYLGCRSEYSEGEPDLDNLIAHAYGYAWKLTGDIAYRRIGTDLFNTAVAAGVTASHKHYAQQFRSSGYFVAYLASSVARACTSPTGQPRVTSVTDAASFQRTGTINGLVSLFGSGFADEGTSYSVGASDLVSNRFPNELGCAAVEVNGVRAPILYVQHDQINVQVPAIDATGLVPVQVLLNPGAPTELRSNPAVFTIQQHSPAIFTFGSNGRDALALIAGTAVPVMSSTTAPGVGRPVRPGEMIELYATGLGVTEPVYQAGEITPSRAVPLRGPGLLTATIAGVDAPVSYAGLAPALTTGLYQVNLTIPQSLPAGDHAIVLRIGGASSQTGVIIPVRP